MLSQIFIISLLIFPASSFLPQDANPAMEVSAADPVHEYVFHKYADLTYDLNQWVEDYPHLMELGTIGTSVLGRELWNIHLTNFETNRYLDLPKVYLDGGHHGNEQCGSEITILMIQHLLENYGTDPVVTDLIDNTHIYITPMINPDGVDLDTRFNSRHVDLNRNYPYMWESSNSPWGGHGSGPASEPEVANNVAFMEKHEFDLILTGHTGIVLLIYPWGYTRDPSPDHNFYLKTEEEVEDLFGIPTGQSSVELYSARGTSKDFGYAGAFAPTWTFEVDDEQFVPVSGERISQRLQPIFDCYLYLMTESVSGKWWPNLTVANTRVMDDDEDGFTLQFTVNNSGYVDVVNGTATLGIDDMTVSGLFSVGQFNETNITFIGEGDFTGKQDYFLKLDYTKLTLNTSKPMSMIHEGKVKIEGDESFVPGLVAGEIIGVIVCMSAILGVFGKRRH